MIEKIKHRIKGLEAELLEIRRHIHAHPELSFEEVETAKYISAALTRHNVEHKTGIAGTGILAIINPEKTNRIALRADIDALPILEESGASYASKNAGIMHACGHDVHTTCALGAAIVLNEFKEEINGRVEIIFQPGEEKLPGGASLVLGEKAFGDVLPLAILGQHVFPELEVGKVGFRHGIYMASTDELFFTIKGKGGHGAMPHKNIDPVVVAAEIICALQLISSRRSNPIIPTVLSIGKVEAKGATNVIPNEVKMEGTFRTLDEDWRYEAHGLIKQTAEGIAGAHGAKAEVEIRIGYPFLTNDVAVTEEAIIAAKEYLGEENVVKLDVRMTAEDFAYYSQVMPACFYRLGTASADGSNSFGVHNSTFNIDESALFIGAGLMAYQAYKKLK
ncbi:MAG: M20 family metallopeptidase [Flavobacteriales bacterium]